MVERNIQKEMGRAREKERAALRLEKPVTRVERSWSRRNAGEVGYGGRKGRHGWLQSENYELQRTCFLLGMQSDAEMSSPVAIYSVIIG